jgi:hypothetical protein
VKPSVTPSLPRVLIGTPTATGDVSSRYMTSVMALSAELDRRQIGWELQIHRGGWVALARNILAGRAVNQEFTHLWFIDGDESFPVAEAMKLWDGMEHSFDEPRKVVGAFYPMKVIDWEKARERVTTAAKERSERFGSSSGVTEDELRTAVLRQTWVRQELGPVSDDGVVEVDWLPTGFMLITTEALREMRERTPGLAYFDRRYGASHAWFTNALLPTYGDLLAEEKLVGIDYCGEDVTFSRLWRKLGGKLWEVKGVQIQHEGRMVF